MICVEIFLLISNTLIAVCALFISYKVWSFSINDQKTSRLMSLIDEYRSVEVGLSMERLYTIKALANDNGIPIVKLYELIINKAEQHEKEKANNYKERRDLDAISIKVDRRRVSHFFSVLLYMLENDLINSRDVQERFSYDIIESVLEPIGIDQDKGLSKIKLLLSENKKTNRGSPKKRESSSNK
jgi:hypothetical protein